MSNTVTRRAATTTAQAVTTRISLGSVWVPSKESALYAAGALRPETEDYKNQQHVLDLLPAAPEGQHWEVKIFHNDRTGKGAPAYDVCLQLCANYQR